MSKKEQSAFLAGTIVGAVVMLSLFIMAAPCSLSVKFGMLVISAFICGWIVDIWKRKK